MIYFIIFMIFVFLYWFLGRRIKSKSTIIILDNISSFIETIFIGILFGILISLAISGAVGSLMQYDYKLTGTYKILAYDIQAKQYCIQDENGLIILNSESSNSVMKFTKKSPYIEEYYAVFDNQWEYLFATPNGYQSRILYKFYTNY